MAAWKKKTRCDSFQWSFIIISKWTSMLRVREVTKGESPTRKVMLFSKSRMYLTVPKQAFNHQHHVKVSYSDGFKTSLFDHLSINPYPWQDSGTGKTYYSTCRSASILYNHTLSSRILCFNISFHVVTNSGLSKIRKGSLKRWVIFREDRYSLVIHAIIMIRRYQSSRLFS